jgi:drug/metabolite transporter (DMT)-like permease
MNQGSSFPTRQQVLAHAALLAVGLIYALNFFLAREVFAEIPPLGMVALRTTFAALIFAIITRGGTHERIDSRADYLRLALCALFGAGANQVMFFQGLSMTVEVNAAILMTTSPLFVFLVAFVMRSEPLTGRKLLGLLLAFGGAVMLSLRGRSLDLGKHTLLGDLLITLNAASFGLYLVLVRPLMQKYQTFTVVMWVFGFGCLITVPIGLPTLLQMDWAAVSVGGYLRALYIILFVTVGTYSLNGWALKRVSAAGVGVYIYLQPVLVALLSLLWGSAPISWLQTGYMLLVFVGVYLVTYRKKTAQTTSLES